MEGVLTAFDGFLGDLVGAWAWLVALGVHGGTLGGAEDGPGLALEEGVWVFHVVDIRTWHASIHIKSIPLLRAYPARTKRLQRHVELALIIRPWPRRVLTHPGRRVRPPGAHRDRLAIEAHDRLAVIGTRPWVEPRLRCIEGVLVTRGRAKYRFRLIARSHLEVAGVGAWTWDFLSRLRNGVVFIYTNACITPKGGWAFDACEEGFLIVGGWSWAISRSETSFTFASDSKR